MRILIHDFGAYSFPFELSIWLARRGHVVMYNFFSDQSKVRGSMGTRKDLPKTLHLREITLPKYNKYNFFAKVLDDRKYGRQLAMVVSSFCPDIVISADTPLDAQEVLVRHCTRTGVPFIYWLQDLISVGVAMALEKKQFPFRGLIAGRYERLERQLLCSSRAVIASSDAFVKQLQSWNAWSESSLLIENWCPLSEISEMDQVNAWSEEKQLAHKTCVVYSGSCGLKHDPDYFLKVANVLDSYGALLVMVAEGPGITWLKEQARKQGVQNIRFFDFQPYERLSEVLATSSILLATNSASASQFCFPSKVLTYMCAGRPILLAAPAGSYISHLLKRSGAGIVTDPHSEQDLQDAIAGLLGSDEQRRAFGRAARDYALEKFNMQLIGPRFEGCFANVAQNGGQHPAPDPSHYAPASYKGGRIATLYQLRKHFRKKKRPLR